jgi:type II secretory pathway pseudopilin PulG
MQAGNRPLPLRRSQIGYGIVWLLAVVALAGLGLATIGTLWATDAQRERERELVRVGTQYALAITSYYYASPISKREYPRSLDALVEDTRSSPPRRHLRRLFVDPVSAGQPWGLVQRADGGITGIYSQSNERPLIQVQIEFGGLVLPVVEQYRDWKFNAKV